MFMDFAHIKQTVSYFVVSMDQSHFVECSFKNKDYRFLQFHSNSFQQQFFHRYYEAI